MFYKIYISEPKAEVKQITPDRDIQRAQSEGIYPSYQSAVNVHTDTAYAYAISLAGIHPQRIPLLLPSLATVAIDTGKITKIELIKEHNLYTNTRIVLDGARELAQFLQQALRGQARHVISLVIKAEQHPYTYSLFGALGSLPSFFPEIRPEHLPNLTYLEYTVTPGSYIINMGLVKIALSGVLKNLKTLHILFSEKLLSVTESPSSYEDIGLATLYNTINATRCPQLTHLAVTLWCEAPTIASGRMIDSLYPQLSVLTLYRAEMGKRKESTFTLEALASVGGAFAVASMLCSMIASETDGEDNPTLDEIIQLHANNNQLTALNIYDWNAEKSMMRYAFEEMATYYTTGRLPHLISLTSEVNLAILLRAFANAEKMTRRVKLLTQQEAPPEKSLLFPVKIPEKMIADILKESPEETLKRERPLEELHLLSESADFQAWLDAIKISEFPLLKRIYYTLTQQHTNETPSAYQRRVEATLHLIETSVLEGKLPHFQTFFLEGEVPEILAEEINTMELRLLKWQFRQKLTEVGLIDK
jgi:hypothetical protein